MGLAVVVPLLLMSGGVARRPAGSEPDWLLFAMPALNQAFFVRHALTCGYVSPPRNLPLLVMSGSFLTDCFWQQPEAEAGYVYTAFCNNNRDTTVEHHTPAMAAPCL